MKKLLSPIIMILISILFIAVIPTEAEGAIYEDTVRLHILANSDNEEDQSLKLKIRDAVLLKYGKELSYFECAEEAKNEIEKLLSEIENFVEKEIIKNGYEYDASVTISTEWYDTRVYENFTLPSGYYSSLEIIIGNGEGQNWWCVMFPPMCLDASTEKVNYSDEEKSLIKKDYTVKLPVVNHLLVVRRNARPYCELIP